MEDLLQEHKMKLRRALSENENVDPFVEELRGMYRQMSFLDSCDSYTPFFSTGLLTIVTIGEQISQIWPFSFLRALQA